MVAEDLEVVKLADAVVIGLPETGLPVLTPLGLEVVGLSKDVELTTPVAEMVLALGVTDVHDELVELATETGAEYCRLPNASRISKVM